MKVVIDGLAIRGMSLAIVTERILHGWQELDVADELHLMLAPTGELDVPPGVVVHRVPFGRSRAWSRIRAQNTALPQLCRRVGADVLFAPLPSTAVLPVPCPRVVLVHDLRHELRPKQFSRGARLIRLVSYGLAYRQATALVAISERTRNDLLDSRPWLRDRVVRVALHGSDHVEGWRPGPAPSRSALAFSQYGNKNAAGLLDAWRVLVDRGCDLPLRIVGAAPEPREQLLHRVAALGLEGAVTVLPWLPEEQFRQELAGAGMVVFPSDFEGFGLPTIEAMRLGIPVVISPDPALVEVAGGHATVIDGVSPADLADAVLRARSTAAAAIEAARDHARTFSWAGSAATIRATLAEAAGH